VVLGRTLLAEAVLTSAFLGVCAAVVFVMGWRASGSILIPLLVALMQIAMAPRFYNYPKLLAYAMAIPALWWYIDRPDRRRLAVLALVGVLAFLLRYDHGVYVGVTPPEHQALMIDRTLRYRVPIAITVAEPEYTADYVNSFPALTNMLRREYREVATEDFGRGFRFRVLIRQGLTPTRTYQPYRLPCFS
jgi:hypothetical protein